MQTPTSVEISIVYEIKCKISLMILSIWNKFHRMKIRGKYVLRYCVRVYV